MQDSYFYQMSRIRNWRWPMNTQDRNSTLASLTFDNRFTRELPADPDTTNRRRQVMGACYSRVHPVRVSAPRLVAYSREAAALLDLSAEACESREFVQVFQAMTCLREWTLTPPATAVISSAIGPDSSATDARSILAKSSTSARSDGHCSLRARVPRLTPGRRTVWRYCVHPCGSFCAARPCFIWGCPPPAH